MRATSCIARAQPANVFHGPFSRGHSERAESGYGGRRPLADEAASENMDYRKQLRLAIGFDDCVDSAGALRQGQDARFTNGLCDLIIRCHAAHRPEHDQPGLGDRRPHDTPPRLCDQSAEAQAIRGTVRLGQDYRRARLIGISASAAFWW
jgi:hypothetical protein